MSKRFLTPVVPPALGSDPANGIAGAIYFNTSLNKLKVYNGTVWEDLGATSDGGGGSGGTSALAEIVSQWPATSTNGTLAYSNVANRLAIYYASQWKELAWLTEVNIDTATSVEGGTAGTSSYEYLYEGGVANTTNWSIVLDGGTAGITGVVSLVEGGASGTTSFSYIIDGSGVTILDSLNLLSGGSALL
jgi:hypothetical protein